MNRTRQKNILEATFHGVIADMSPDAIIRSEQCGIALGLSGAMHLLQLIDDAEYERLEGIATAARDETTPH